MTKEKQLQRSTNSIHKGTIASNYFDRLRKTNKQK